MSSQSDVEFWAEVGASKEDRPQIGLIYERRKPENNNRDVQTNHGNRDNIFSFAPNERICWNRSLSIRGRQSVVIAAGTEYRPRPQQREAKKKPRQPFLNKKIGQHPPDFKKEIAYFQEVDSFELMEESPSPKNFTWAMGVHNIQVAPDLSSILERWMISKKINCSCRPSRTPMILETPVVPLECIFSDASASSFEKMPEKTSKISFNSIHSVMVRNSQETMQVSTKDDAACEDLGEAVKKLSLTSLSGDHFSKLLMICEQSAPSRLSEVFSQYCDLSSIIKIGEGTYGEAFKAGATVCKIVPIDGDLRVNGEVQKRSSELLEEAMLCWTLNSLRGQEGNVDNQNKCTNFIETKDIQVCQGAYDAFLIRAWEDWDAKHGSENDHPKEFPENQCYVVFVLSDGGKDLESFVLLNYDEARSLLAQVTAALAVAEVACEFEHRDLHWGNILLARNGAQTSEFILQGKQMWAKTFGLSVSIIDFTLSRINAGEAIFFLDLSADPELFEGPKGDRQAETYRKMKDVTEDCWDGSFPKTNVLWLQYLVDVLLLKKTFPRTTKDERVLRSLRKSLNSYDSAKEALSDAFFSELLVDQSM